MDEPAPSDQVPLSNQNVTATSSVESGNVKPGNSKMVFYIGVVLFALSLIATSASVVGRIKKGLDATNAKKTVATPMTSAIPTPVVLASPESSNDLINENAEKLITPLPTSLSLVPCGGFLGETCPSGYTCKALEDTPNSPKYCQR